MHAGVLCGLPDEAFNSSQYITLKLERIWKMAVVVKLKTLS
jgi:hypothetical protein